MSSSFLTVAASPFHGVAPIAGGTWAGARFQSLAAGPRVYLATGYRDYLWTTTRTLIDDLHAAGLPADELFVRRSGGGHELHPWYWEELFAFLDRGERPGSGAVAAPWTVETLPDGADVNALVVDGTALVAAGAGGRVWRRGTSWQEEHAKPTADYAALCTRGGASFTGGGYSGAKRTSSTAWVDAAPLPDYGMLGTGWINGLDCRADGSLLAVGYWSAEISSDGGATWTQFHAPGPSDVEALMAGIATSPSGATVIVGDWYVGRAAAGASAATQVDQPDGWLNAVTAVAGGLFWAVGDGGQIRASRDDGQTWTAQTSGTTDDLYAVHFADAQHGAAVGRRGTVLVTADGGATWQPRPLGRASYLGAVHVDANEIWVAGEDGIVAHAAL
jgi:photosystem II stability/assembly factor-like uncharacterized protein